MRLKAAALQCSGRMAKKQRVLKTMFNKLQRGMNAFARQGGKRLLCYIVK